MLCNCLISLRFLVNYNSYISMSRSKRKTPMKTFAESQKEDKRLVNRKFRHRAKQAINTGHEPPYRLREVSNVYCFADDGKTYWGFDYEKIDRLMRK